ncbi:MAG: T9SS type B sorting domain-containing protein [Bacteroidales bacterium]|nr:T9SS type B sorting domain-containing protein [Bacteroidales bacterium]
MKKIFSTLILTLIIINSYSQYQAFNWLVGDHILSFKQQSVLDEYFPTLESSPYATITTNNTSFSTKGGLLTAYSNENTLYNVLDVTEYSFIEQPALNQPAVFIADTNMAKFTIFDGFYLENTNVSHTLYHTNDLFQFSPTEIGNGYSSKMATYRDVDSWNSIVVVHELGTNIFSSYGTYYSSFYNQNTGPTYGSQINTDYDDGYMKFSPLGNYLAVSSPNMNDLRVYSYVMSFGADSIDSEILSVNSYAFDAIEFAAGDNDILYAADDYNIYQLNVWSGNPVLIGTSDHKITNMQLGPDGKIYVAKQGADYLGIIYNPEIYGEDCYYDDYGLYIPNPLGTLPAFPANYFKNIPIITWFAQGSEVMVGDEISFNIQNLFPDNVIWYFDDGITDYGDFAYHTFSTPGVHHVDVKMFFNNYQNDFLDSVLIRKKVVVHDLPTSEIFPGDTTICDTTQFITLSVDYDEGVYEIYWSTDGFWYSEMYGSEISINFPGKYWVDIYEQGIPVANDTVIINYALCDGFDVNILTADGSMCGEDFFTFTADINQAPNSCDFDINDFYYVWDFGGAASLTGYGLNQVENVFDVSGSYLITLHLFDSKGCEHIAQKQVYSHLNPVDSANITLSEVPTGNISINLEDYFDTESDFYDNNFFIQEVNIPLSDNKISNTITIPEGYISTIEEANDFYLYTNVAYKGDISIELVAPSGNSCYVTYTDGAITNATTLLGHPAIDFENSALSICNSYFFTDGGKDINVPNNDYLLDIYYSPDNHLFFTYGESKFYYIPTDFYDFVDAESIVGESVAGNWTINFTGYYENGFLKSWGLVFPNYYYLTKVKPIETTCSDIFGNTYTTTDSIINITNSTNHDITLFCDFKYETGCTISKQLYIDVPDGVNIPDSFSPNGDGINDTWRPVDLRTEVDIFIIDKNGQIVANFRNTDNPYGWDGTFNDNPIPSDSYWYIIKYNDGAIVKGVISIIR